jgi:hypothetical protein
VEVKMWFFKKKKKEEKKKDKEEKKGKIRGDPLVILE